MPSQALLAFDNALGEVRDLGRVARPSLSERTDSLRIARAVGRAQVVLLSSHFERYFYAVNEEAVDFVNAKHISATVLSSRLNFFILGIQSMISRQWIGRAERNGFCRSFRRMHGCGQVAARVHCCIVDC